MIPRYTLAEMEQIWNEEKRFELMLKVEMAVLEVLAEKKIIPKKDYEEIKKRVKLNVDRIKEIENITKHDVAAFIDQISESVGSDASRWIHFGLTSSDILDTATGLQLKLSCDLIIKKLKELIEILKIKIEKHKFTIMMGRTHGVHAEPITLGYKFASWYYEISQHLEILNYLKDIICVGKISGVVGTYSQLSPEIEKKVLHKLGLRPEPISTQVIPRFRYVYYIATLANIAASIERFSLEIRHLQRTEVLEIEEPFSKGQKGSSAMPHKRNPISSENLCGLARVVRGYVICAYENVALWHERDISHSSVERIILPDASILIHYMLNRFIELISNLIVYPKNMLRNIKKSYDSFYSQTLLSELIKRGLTRQQAYSLVQPVAQKALLRRKNFVKLCCNEKEISKYLSKKEIKKICSIEYLLRHLKQKFDEIQ